MPYAPFDLFAFARPGPLNDMLIDRGMLLPWWTDRQLLVAFFRPLASLTHVDRRVAMASLRAPDAPAQRRLVCAFAGRRVGGVPSLRRARVARGMRVPALCD